MLLIQPFNDMDDLFSKIDFTTDKIEDVLSQYELIDEDIDELNELYKVRNIMITELLDYLNSDDTKHKEKIRIREFIDIIAIKDRSNINSLDSRLKDIGLKIKFLNNKKNLKIYSKWSK